MLVNRNVDTNNGHVKFISYTGEYPYLCMGVLTLEIDGKRVKFGNDCTASQNYPSFWASGGTCGFYDDYIESYCTSREWEIDVEDIPEQYRKYANEIDECFNDNVPYGCCGGCL